MEFSFRTWCLLQLAVIGLSVLSIIYPYFAVFAATIATVLLISEVSSRGAEREDFKGIAAEEVLLVLDHLADTASLPDVSYPCWRNKGEKAKELLGDRDYELWKSFYDNVKAYSNFLRVGKREGYHQQDLRKLRQTCFDSFFVIYKEVPWVRQFIPQERIASYSHFVSA